MCECKIDTGSSGNLIPIKIFKALYPTIKITDLNKSIDKHYYAHKVTNKCVYWLVTCFNKIDEIFKDLPNIFNIADDILIVGHYA